MVHFELGSQVDETRGVVRYRGALGLLDQQMLRDSRLHVLCYAKVLCFVKVKDNYWEIPR